MKPGGQFTTRIDQSYIERLEGAPTGAPFHALLLFDFETGDHEIRENHQRGLRQHLYQYFSTGNFSIWVGGLASRLGAEAQNMRLSHFRAREVSNRIEFQNERVQGLRTTSFGERFSQTGSEDNAYARAVIILLYRIPPYREPAHPHATGPLPFFNKFKITLIYGIEGGELLVGGDYHFLIDYDDREHNAPPSNECEYSLVGLGGGIGAPAGAQGGISWNRFSTPHVCTPHDFSGRGSIGGYGLNIWTFNLSSTTLNLFPSRNAPINIEEFQTESSVSFGYSRIYGAFFRSGS